MSDGSGGPRDDTTFQDMQRKRPQIPVAPLPEEVLNFQPEVPVHFDPNQHHTSFGGSGHAQDAGQCSGGARQQIRGSLGE